MLAGAAMWMELLGLRWPFTMKHKPDNEGLWHASDAPKIDYPKPDGVLTFDRLSSVFISNTNHEEDQPVHLTLKDPESPSLQSSDVRRAGAALLSGGCL
jgi:electron-transferring-flavoprotein dehydrogenase